MVQILEARNFLIDVLILGCHERKKAVQKVIWAGAPLSLIFAGDIGTNRSDWLIDWLIAWLKLGWDC